MHTLKIVVNAIGNDEQIIAQSVCKHITFGEDESISTFPTVDWLWKAPDGSTDYVQRTRGSRMTFEASPRNFFHPGDLVAYVKTASGSSSFTQEEI